MLRRQVQDRREPPTVSAPELLDLLGDEYTRAVLAAVIEEPRSATEVASVTAVSKPTAFRRLNRLEEAGLVESRPAISSENGHHYDEYRVAFDALSVQLDGIDVTVERER